MCRKKRYGEGEVGVWEDRECLHEDICDSLVAIKVWVELVSNISKSAEALARCSRGGVIWEYSDRANISTSTGGGIHSPVPRVIGNVVVKCSSLDSLSSKKVLARTISVARGLHSNRMFGFRIVA